MTKAFLLLIITLLDCTIVFGQTKLLDVKVLTSNVVYTDSILVYTSRGNFTVQPTGEVKGIIDGNDVQFELPKDDEYWIVSLDWAENDSTYIVFYQESIGTHSGYSLSIIDKSTYKVSEKYFAGGFNFGTPIFKDQFIYLRSIGTVGKFDLNKREYAWLHRDLYDRSRGTFNTINEPIFLGDRVLFISVNTFETFSDSLLIDDKSGSIIYN